MLLAFNTQATAPQPPPSWCLWTDSPARNFSEHLPLDGCRRESWQRLEPHLARQPFPGRVAMRAAALLANARIGHAMLGSYFMATYVLYDSQAWLLLLELGLLALLPIVQPEWSTGPQIAVGEHACLPTCLPA